MKNQEYIVASALFVIGLFVFNVDNAFKFGRYFVQSLFILGLAIVIYRAATKNKKK